MGSNLTASYGTTVGADVFFSLTSSTLSASSARQRCHGTIDLRSRSVEAGLLQRSTCRSTSVDVSVVVTCSTRGSTSGARCEAIRPHQSQSTTSALVANRWTNQALPSRPQRSSWTWTIAGLYYWLTPARRDHFIVASHESWRLQSCHGQTAEDSQIKHSPLLHDGRGTNCRLILKWHN